MNKQFHDSLLELGLSDKQARVYLALLTLGEATKSELARAAGLKRPTTYLVLEQLEEASFITSRRDGSRELIRALSPYGITERKRKAVDRFTQQIPELLALNSRLSLSPQISILAGPESIERSMDDRLNTQTELYFWADNYLQFSHHRLAHGPQKEYMRKRIAKGIWTRGIIPYERRRTYLRKYNLVSAQKFYLKLKRQGPKEFREFVFVPRAEVARMSEIWIFDNKVEFYSREDLVGARIVNNAYAETMRGIFRSHFEHAKQKESSVLSEEDLEYLST